MESIFIVRNLLYRLLKVGVACGGTSVASGSGAAEALLHKEVEALTQNLECNAVDYIDHKSLREHAARFIGGNTARLHIEHSPLVELAGGGAVAALYLIAVNLELRGRNHTGHLAVHDVAVCLLGVGKHGTVLHHNFACEATFGVFE